MATIYIDNVPYEVKDRRQSVERLSLARFQHSLLLLAPSHAFGGIMPIMRSKTVSR